MRRKKKDNTLQKLVLGFGAIFALQGLALAVFGKKAEAR